MCFTHTQQTDLSASMAKIYWISATRFLPSNIPNVLSIGEAMKDSNKQKKKWKNYGPPNENYLNINDY